MSLPAPLIDGALAILPPCSFAPAIDKVHAIAVDERCPTPVLSAIISNDPGMAFLLLSRANMTVASDSHRNEFVGVPAAINQLGLAGTAALLSELDIIPDHLVRPLSSFWSAASAQVIMARLLLRRCQAHLFPGAQDTHLVAAGAVLADLGPLVALRIFGEQYALAGNRLMAGEPDFNSLLGEELGMSAGELGARYALAWGLPTPIADALRMLHDPTRDQPGQHFSCLLNVARSLTCACGYPAGVDHFVSPISHQVLSILGLRNNDLTATIDDFFQEMRHLEYFEVATSSQR